MYPSLTFIARFTQALDRRVLGGATALFVGICMRKFRAVIDVGITILDSDMFSG